MQTIKLGHTGEQVSAMCLGCMYFGTQIDEQQSFRLLDQYVDAGGSFLDTANNYAYWVQGFQGGESEQLIGRWFTQRKNRDQIFLATKVGFNMSPRVPTSLSRQTIIEQCENSLRQLQTDHIDLYYAHTDHRETPLEETLEALDQLVRQGKVKHIACSNTFAWRIQQARMLSQSHGWPEYCAVQQRHSYLTPKTNIRKHANKQVSTTIELIDYAIEHAEDFVIVAYSILLGGIYARDDNRIPDNYQPEEYSQAEVDAKMKVLREVANEVGATPNQVVIACLMQNTPRMIPLITSSSQERLQENIDAGQVTLSADHLARLNQVTY
jgi:aryl-alcohol dehydrogenase-like predicted oxidoreductase